MKPLAATSFPATSKATNSTKSPTLYALTLLTFPNWFAEAIWGRRGSWGSLNLYPLHTHIGAPVRTKESLTAPGAAGAVRLSLVPVRRCLDQINTPPFSAPPAPSLPQPQKRALARTFFQRAFARRSTPPPRRGPTRDPLERTRPWGRHVRTQSLAHALTRRSIHRKFARPHRVPLTRDTSVSIRLRMPHHAMMARSSSDTTEPIVTG